MNNIMKRIFVVLVWLMNIISFAPILYLSSVDRASGDDWGFGCGTHIAWVTSHNLIEVLKASFEETKSIYYSWQGTWFSVILFTLQPEVFSHRLYWIVPIIMTTLIVVSVSAFLYFLLVKLLQTKIVDYLLVDGIAIFMLIEFVDSPKSAIFWWNGAIHYTLPLCMALFAVIFSIKYLFTKKAYQIVVATILMILLGGMNYLAAFFAPLMIAAIAFVLLLNNIINIKKVLPLFVPIILECIGLLISAIAPGNKARGGSQYEVSLPRAFQSLWMSFIEGNKGVFTSFVDKKIICAVLIMLAVIIWNIMRNNNSGIQFRYPIMVLIMNFFIYCTMYWPGIFAGVSVSGGVPNTIYQVSIICYICSAMYLFGWINNKLSVCNSNWIKNIDSFLGTILIGVALILLLIGKGGLKNSVSYISYDYIRTGQASDYKAQMDEFTSILLDDNIADAVVPAINNEQGPLMHMNVTENKDAWTNKTVAEFFGKNSVVSK